MAKILSKAGIASLNIVRPWHVSQSVDAFAGLKEYDIYLSGSFNTTGSITATGNISGSARVFGTHMIATNVISTPSIENGTTSDPIAINDSITLLNAISNDITSSGHYSSSGDIFFNPSNTTTGTSVLTIDPSTGQVFRTGSYTGGGGGSAFPFTGSAGITGSINLIGPITSSGDISSSGDFYANRFNATGYVSTPLLTVPGGEMNINCNLSGSGAIPSTASFGLFEGTNINASNNISASGNIMGNDISSSGDILIKGGGLDIKNTGAQSYARFYCESANAHYTELKAQPHALFSGNPVVLLPAYDLDFAAPNFQAAVTASTFSGDGAALTNLQRPITSSTTHFTASNNNSGFYFRGDGSVTCSIQLNSVVTCEIGNEFEIFQTSSAGYVLFATGSGVTLNSKTNLQKLAGQFSAATLKKVGTDEWDLIGDLG